MFNNNVYTTESVTSGHPDKVCDQISDAILDACLDQDSHSRVAAETFGSNQLIVLGGEITTKAKLNFESIALSVYRKIGYTDSVRILSNINQQSPDIARGVDVGGAGDQGIMYGYATDETAEMLPLGVVLVHRLTAGLENLRTSNKLTWLKPDGKAQVTIENRRVRTVLVSCQHDEQISQSEIKKELIDKLIQPTISNLENINILVNPTGKFVLGGLVADTGLTGRKIMVDTYGGLIPHGGGAFSGKDATKVDRSAAYMARFAAKNLVGWGLAKQCLVSVSYAIGKQEPLMLQAVNEHGDNLSETLQKHFDFRPQAILERLDLRKPIYLQTATYGHFGKSQLPWEQFIDRPIFRSPVQNLALAVDR